MFLNPFFTVGIRTWQQRNISEQNDDCINIEGEGAPNVVGLFKGKSENSCSINRYECNLADLRVILLQQVASQIIGWLHEEAVIAGMKASRDFLSLWFEVEQGEVLGLVAHVDPEGGGISWWLVMGNGMGMEMGMGKEYNKQQRGMGW